MHGAGPRLSGCRLSIGVRRPCVFLAIPTPRSRTMTMRSRMRARSARRQQAHHLLASTYGWFTEGFDTLDLKEAKASRDEPCV